MIHCSDHWGRGSISYADACSAGWQINDRRERKTGQGLAYANGTFDAFMKNPETDIFLRVPYNT